MVTGRTVTAVAGRSVKRSRDRFYQSDRQRVRSFGRANYASGGVELPIKEAAWARPRQP